MSNTKSQNKEKKAGCFLPGHSTELYYIGHLFFPMTLAPDKNLSCTGSLDHSSTETDRRR